MKTENNVNVTNKQNGKITSLRKQESLAWRGEKQPNFDSINKTLRARM
jgi:hypothetical protein